MGNYGRKLTGIAGSMRFRSRGSRITTEMYDDIFASVNAGISIYILQQKYDVSRSTIMNALTGRTERPGSADSPEAEEPVAVSDPQ